MEAKEEQPLDKVLRSMLRTKKLTAGVSNKGFYDPWDHKNKLMRYAGDCVSCGSRIFQLSDDYATAWNQKHWYDPDPRGAINERHAAHVLVASEYSMLGPDVPVCFDCANAREKYENALAIARRDYWFEKIDNIMIIGRRWFDKVNGNTYFSSRMIVNGRAVGMIDYAYGYGDQYVHESYDWLEAHGYIQFKTRKQTPRGCDPITVKAESYWQLCERLGITHNETVTDVSRKRDL